MNRAIIGACGIALTVGVGWATRHGRSTTTPAPGPARTEVAPCGDTARERGVRDAVFSTAGYEATCWELRRGATTRWLLAGRAGTRGELVLVGQPGGVIEGRRALGEAPAWSFELLHDDRARPGEVDTVLAARAGDQVLAFDVTTLARLDPAILARP